MTSSLATPERAVAGWNGFGRAVPAAALIGACAASALTPLADDDGQILCPYRLATGGWCPGCGCTRAFRSLTHLDVRAALALNPWALLLAVQAMLIVTWIAAAPEQALAWWRRYDTRFLAVNSILGVTIWITRLGLGDIPTPF